MAQFCNLAIGVSLAFCALFSPILGRTTGTQQWDPNGYVLYCPCSGRFSNQVELFLGALLFSKTLGRTLIVPPIIEYQHTIGVEEKNLYAPFTDYFDLAAVQEYHEQIITMEDFLETHADMKWPQEMRKAYCSSDAAEMNNGICTRGGNPFGTFWEDNGILFEQSEIWEDPLFFNVEHGEHAEKWMETFKADDHPVLTFMNAPTFNPIAQEAEQLHQYLQWAPSVIEEGNKIIEQLKRPYIAIHLRNGADWTRTCDLTTKNYQRILSSYQCTGRLSGDTYVTRNMCIQSEEQVAEEVSKKVQELKARSVFVGTDHVSMQDDLQDHMDKKKADDKDWDLNVKIVHADPDRPQVDMYVMAQADHFIGNCVSAFSAFINREREALGKAEETSFFGWPLPEDNNHDEL